jgi:hypothetical protein
LQWSSDSVALATVSTETGSRRESKDGAGGGEPVEIDPAAVLAGVAVELGVQGSTLQVCTWDKWVEIKTQAETAAASAVEAVVVPLVAAATGVPEVSAVRQQQDAEKETGGGSSKRKRD